MFFIAGITITFFLVLLLVGKKGRTAADGILACWLFFLGVHLLLYYLFFSEKLYDFPSLLGLEIPLPLLHGPFLYLYTLALTGRLPRQKVWVSIHFLPAALSYGYMLGGFFLRPEAERLDVYRHGGRGYETYMAINLAAIFVSGVAYVLLSLVALRRHRKTIHNLFSYEKRISLWWMRYLIFGIAVIWTMVFLGNDTLIFASTVVFIFFVGYFGIKQVGIFSLQGTTPRPDIRPAPAYPEQDRPAAIPDETETPEGQRKKYQKSGLTPDAVHKISDGLHALMHTEKLFRDNELTLNTLATRLGVHPNYVSQVINETQGKNFYDYVNGLRIEEFIRLSARPENRKYTILHLAMECGFNSKSSFNKYFKKVTGLSPTDYWNREPAG